MSDNSPEQSDQNNGNQSPTTEEPGADMSIPATFDEVMQAVVDDYGVR